MKISVKVCGMELELTGGFAFAAVILLGGGALVVIEIILLKVLR